MYSLATKQKAKLEAKQKVVVNGTKVDCMCFDTLIKWNELTKILHQCIYMLHMLHALA